MRIALLQGEAVPLDLERNLSTIRDAAARAREAGAELLLAPELFISGYAPRELAGWLTAERVAGIPAALARIAKEAGIAVASGFPAARADGSFAIAAGLWDADGVEVLRYEKVHLWGSDEPLAFTASSDRPGVAEWNGRRVGFQICYDIEFPEPIRSLAERGADLVLVPTAIDGVSDYIPEVLVRARAAENSLVVAYADHAVGGDGNPSPDTFAGLSVVAGRDGAVHAAAGRGSELLLADIPDVIPVETGADYLRDRRPEVYSGWR
ncbi:nitrilase-related carbon-nitrogen hydrolase [Leucobacter ruminantium]|uniref:Nitrilase n=1 Tax=Leucobacter ruminantium TaxID=1289170 RepID=A0A939LX98_9MICO|nr:nitrilase-related carbon-nitrogen hydrolase [Leucobacter ruminantium]MBO1806519.1 nitrilase [Leucobacter ruminantium]